MFFGIFKSKKPVLMASPMPTLGIIETSLIAGIGTSVLITVAPAVSTYLGSYLACQTVGCAIGTSLGGGFAGGSCASAASIGASTVAYKMRYKHWLKENGGKYIVNQLGKLEMVPMAFIVPKAVTISPLTLIVLTNSYCFFKAYINKKVEIEEHLEDV